MEIPLPTPDSEAAAHGVRVAAHVGELIDTAGGAIPFADYMEAVLYAAGLGYYSAGSEKFGAAGDFVTAPELSPLFARALGSQFAALHRAHGLTQLLELGAGSGRFAADALVELARIDALPERYLMLEVSADLRARQRATLEALAPALLDRVEWLEALPAAFEGVVFANEVLDALPVERFRRTSAGVEQITVIRDGAAFGWGARAAPADLERAVAALEDDLGASLPSGYVSEINLRVGPWLAALSSALARGVMLFVDYGMSRREYYAADRDGGTLRCHYRHRAHDDPLVWPGLQDLTTQVEFTAVAEAGVAAGLGFAGYTTQAHLLIGCGLEALLAEPVPDDRARWLRAQQAQRLTMPAEMGERFKAIGFTRGVDAPLAAFAVRDLRDRL
ncbi:MAG: SAM-dependent methyltransferase [Gammaproteobacteria bacterium]